jgi:hypothetical protein
MRHRARLARHNSYCGITNKGKEMAFAPPTVEPRVIQSIVMVSDTQRMPQSVRRPLAASDSPACGKTS